MPRLIYTYKRLPASPRRCSSVWSIWFDASRLIKHLQCWGGGVLNKGWGGCAARSCCILIKLGIRLPHCLLPWQQTEISLQPLHPSAFQHRYRPPLSPLSAPHPSSYYPPVSSEHHLEFGECSSIDRLQMSGARLVTWLIQMSVQLLHRLSRYPLRVSLVPTLAIVKTCTVSHIWVRAVRCVTTCPFWPLKEE